MILGLFSSAPEHPLADARELKRVIDELPSDNDFKAVDEITAWLESLENADGFRADRLNEVLRQLDDAVQPHIRRLSRQYLTTQRLSKTEERRYWSVAIDCWDRLARLYEMALVASQQKDKAADALKPQLALINCRLIHALGSLLKWTHFKYGPVDGELWRRIGAAYLFAERGRLAEKTVQLYPGLPANSTATLEYLKPLILASSALDSLMPLEIELADRLVAHFLPHFVLSAGDRADNIYWVDPASDQPPKRLAKLPPAAVTNRFIAPGKAPAAFADLIHVVERGDIPADLALGGQYSPRLVLSVLRHIAMYWSERPPVRLHQRHAVKTRLFVMHGFDNCTSMFDGHTAELGDRAECWVVDNVSMGGFGAQVAVQRDEWLRIGALLCVQPEGGDNWLLGIVRRYGKETENLAGVGIQTIAKQAMTLDLRPRGSPSYGAASAITGIACRDVAGSEEIRVVLPTNTFDVRESLDTRIDGQAVLLSPIELLESGPDYELGRYRARIVQ